MSSFDLLANDDITNGFENAKDLVDNIDDGISNEEIYRRWLQIKRIEQQTYAYRTEVLEPQIIQRLQISSAPLTKTTSTTINADGYRIKVARNIAYKTENLEQLELIFSDAPDLKPYTLKASISGSQLTKLSESHPNLYQQACKHLVSHENKITINIEPRKESHD